MNEESDNPIIITYTLEFKREYKRLAKKYFSLQADVKALVAELEEKPTLSTPSGDNVFKIRLSIASKTKVKVVVRGSLLILLQIMPNCIYSPSMINQTKAVLVIKLLNPLLITY